MFFLSEDIHVEFYEEDDKGNIEWSAEGRFSANHVHKQFAITLITPPYRDQNVRPLSFRRMCLLIEYANFSVLICDNCCLQITKPVACKVRLRQLKDPLDGKPRDFEYLPRDAGMPPPLSLSLSSNLGLLRSSPSTTVDPVESFRRILAADSGLLLDHVKFASEFPDYQQTSKESHTPPPLPAKRSKKPRSLFDTNCNVATTSSALTVEPAPVPITCGLSPHVAPPDENGNEALPPASSLGLCSDEASDLTVPSNQDEAALEELTLIMQMMNGNEPEKPDTSGRQEHASLQGSSKDSASADYSSFPLLDLFA